MRRRRFVFCGDLSPDLSTVLLVPLQKRKKN